MTGKKEAFQTHSNLPNPKEDLSVKIESKKIHAKITAPTIQLFATSTETEFLC